VISGRETVLRAVCPVAPPGQAQTWADNITGWVQWGVLAILAMSFFASVGMMVWGKIWSHPKGARLGLEGLAICLVTAITYVSGYTVITGITGTGCV
jgi:hypothetical protein